MRHVALAALVVAVWCLPGVAHGQAQPAASLIVNTAEPGSGGDTVVIAGARFGRRPFVTMDLVPLNVQFSNDSQIVAAAPTRMMPAGEYLVTVTRGEPPGDSASIVLTLGGSAAPAPAGPPSDISLPPNPTDAVATVGDRTITVAEIDREWQRTDPAGYLAMVRTLYEQRRRVVDAMVADDLIAREAKARGTTPEALLAQEIPDRIVTLPESAVASLYQSLGDRTRGASLEQMRPALRAWLERNTEREMARMHFVEELMRTSTRAEVRLAAPRVTVAPARLDQSLGPDGAGITIVAFGDFYSLEYGRFGGVFPRVIEQFGNRVRVVFKHLPVTVPESATASEAAACAGDQGRFWEFHDAVIGVTGALSVPRLKELATQAGVDRARFDPCLDGGTFAEPVLQSIEEASRYAVSGSPTFLINGRLAPPPPPFLPPFEFFTRLIEEELSLQAQAARGR